MVKKELLSKIAHYWYKLWKRHFILASRSLKLYGSGEAMNVWGLMYLIFREKFYSRSVHLASDGGTYYLIKDIFKKKENCTKKDILGGTR